MELVNIEDAQEILEKILNEIDKMPVRRSKAIIIASEYDYNLLVELKKAHWLDFTLLDTVPADPIPENTNNTPFLQERLYRIEISFRKQGDAIYIETKDGEEIKYFIKKGGAK